MKVAISSILRSLVVFCLLVLTPLSFDDGGRVVENRICADGADGGQVVCEQELNSICTAGGHDLPDRRAVGS